MSHVSSSSETIFAEAISIASPQDRASFLEQACQGDTPLLREVQKLVQDHFLAGSFLEHPAARIDTTPPQPLLERSGTQIGSYKLLEQIGEGGMGVVFMAEQRQPIQRKVALKIIKPGMDTQQVIARFEAERQALALMDHPNIARVLEAGTTESGRPYFVMELVHGMPVTDYCDRHRLLVRERLELFVTICQAVQHAHQKGIIHRDLKPTNVLVAQHDGLPLVKVIDFGVAKATSQKLTEKTVFTGIAQLIGTPLYMSPEQAELNAPDVDTRSDIYSLGVLLYELLTGSTPFETERLKAAAFDEMRRIIREEEPPRPSTRISTLVQQAISTVSEKRNSDPRHLSRLFQGELDWIAMKTLEKDRNRRYETASALAADVERYLRDEPVHACPPSAVYRFRKFARRNMVALVTAAVVLATLILGTVVSTWQAIRATHAEQQALVDRDLKEQARREAAVVSKFLVNALHRPDLQRGGRTITIAERLDLAAQEAQGTFADNPRLLADLLEAIGQTYQGLEPDAEVVPLFEKTRDLRTAALGPDDPETLMSMKNLAGAYTGAGRLDEALLLYDETLKRLKTKLGPANPETLSCMFDQAMAFNRAGRIDDAVSLFEETLRLRKSSFGPNHPDTLRTMLCLALTYDSAGRTAESKALFAESLRLRKAQWGDDYPDTLAEMLVVGNSLLLVGQDAEGLSLLEEELALSRTKLGMDAPGTLAAMSGLAENYRARGRLDEAVSLLKETLALSKAKLGADHPDTLTAMSSLAEIYRERGRVDEAVSLLEETLKLKKAKLGPDTPETLNTLRDLIKTYESAGRVDDVIRVKKERLDEVKRSRGPDHPETRAAILDLADTYEAAGRLDESAALHDEFLRLKTAMLGPDHRDTIDAKNGLCLLLLVQGKFAEAETLLSEDLPSVRAHLPPDDLVLARRLHNLALALLQQDKFAEAEPPARESLEIRAKKIPDEWGPFQSRSLLGGALLGQKKYAAAEPLLVSGYEGMHEREAKIPATRKLFLRQALERLVRLYEATSQPEQLDQWKEKLAEYDKAESKKSAPATTN